MNRSTFVKIRTLCLIVVLLFTPFFLSLTRLYSEEVKQEKSSPVIEVKNGRISIDVKDIDLSILLKEIEQKVGVRITISRELTGKKVTTRFSNLDIESALRNILGTNYVLVFVKDDKDQFKLKEVMAVGYFSSKPTPEKIIKKEIAYGSGKENVGIVRNPLVGPKSFSVDDQGNIYILDTVNNRVQVFSSNMEYLSTIPLKGQGLPDDVVIDRYGFIYVIDGHVNLHQYDRNGNMINKIRIDEGRWKARRAMHIINQNIYVNACDPKTCADYIIARIINGVLTPPSFEDLRKPVGKGMYGSSGRRYRVSNFARGEKAEIEIIEKNDTPSQTIFLSLKEILSISFLGEDEKGNIYFITERGMKNELSVEIHKFNFAGVYLKTVLMPESNISFWSIKNYSVNSDGTIYRFLPEEDKLRLTIFRWDDTEGGR